VTGLFEGRSLFVTDTALLSRKLAELPWVKSVKVTRKFPSSLRVRFTGRKAVAFLHTPTELGPRLFLVDADGVLLDEPVGTAFPDGPVVTGLEVKNAFLGRTVEMPELSALLKVLAGLKETDYALYSSLQEIRMENSEGLVRYRLLLTEQNIPLRADRLDAGMFSDLEALLRHYGSAGAIKSIVATDGMLFVEERI
jgi:hypothetical protein